MEKTMSERRLSALVRDGWQIHYAPVSGRLCRYREGDYVQDVSISEFIEAKASGEIVKVDEMMQGHSMLHGRVDFYGAPAGSAA